MKIEDGALVNVFGHDVRIYVGADEKGELGIYGKWYTIKGDYLRTEGDLVEWIYRLCKEDWFTTHHIVDLIHRFEDMRGIMQVKNLPSIRYADSDRQANLVARLCPSSRYAVEGELG